MRSPGRVVYHMEVKRKPAGKRVRSGILVAAPRKGGSDWPNLAATGGGGSFPLDRSLGGRHCPRSIRFGRCQHKVKNSSRLPRQSAVALATRLLQSTDHLFSRTHPSSVTWVAAPLTYPPVGGKHIGVVAKTVTLKSALQVFLRGPSPLPVRRRTSERKMHGGQGQTFRHGIAGRVPVKKAPHRIVLRPTPPGKSPHKRAGGEDGS